MIVIDCKKVGSLILELRKEKNMTQKQLADLMNISDKTISKWERGLGCPDISLIPELAQIFGVNIDILLSGEINSNDVVGGNMNKLKFYVCTQCGNMMTATGNAQISCCGKKLEALEAKKVDDKHKLIVEPVEDELYVTTEHDMTKEHYVSFVAALSAGKIQMIKLYPEGNAEARFKINGVKKILFYCNRDGLFSLDVVKGIDDKKISYDDVEERRALEQTAKMLFG